jgi:phage FluMu protein Com
MNEGDLDILNSFNNLKNLMSDYAKSIDDISSLIGNIVTRIIAKIDPTPQNKLRVVSLPKTKEISVEINKRIDNIKGIKIEILKKIKDMENVLNNAKIPCPKCKGEGKIPKIDYARDSNFITPVIEYEKCPTCDGLAFFEISKEILETANEALNSIKNLS